LRGQWQKLRCGIVTTIFEHTSAFHTGKTTASSTSIITTDATVALKAATTSIITTSTISFTSITETTVETSASIIPVSSPVSSEVEFGYTTSNHDLTTNTKSTITAWSKADTTTTYSSADITTSVALDHEIPNSTIFALPELEIETAENSFVLFIVLAISMSAFVLSILGAIVWYKKKRQGSIDLEAADVDYFGAPINRSASNEIIALQDLPPPECSIYIDQDYRLKRVKFSTFVNQEQPQDENRPAALVTSSC
jgi:hypothetical protein